MGDLISRQALCEYALNQKDKSVTPNDIMRFPSAQSEQRWIPVTERLPEESERYLISAFDGVWRRTTIAQYQPRYKAWTMTGRMAYWKVVAWMPLPEPYKEGKND